MGHKRPYQRRFTHHHEHHLHDPDEHHLHSEWQQPHALVAVESQRLDIASADKLDQWLERHLVKRGWLNSDKLNLVPDQPSESHRVLSPDVSVSCNHAVRSSGVNAETWRCAEFFIPQISPNSVCKNQFTSQRFSAFSAPLILFVPVLTAWVQLKAIW